MTSLVMLFAMVCGAVLQAVLPKWQFLGQANPPVLLGIVLYYTLTHDRRLTLQAAIVGGVLQDALGMIPLGYSSFCFCVVALAIGHFKDIVFVHEVLTHTLFGALAAGTVTLMLYILLVSEGQLVLRPAWGVMKIFGSAILGGILVPFEFEVMESFDRMVGNIESRES